MESFGCALATFVVWRFFATFVEVGEFDATFAHASILVRWLLGGGSSPPSVGPAPRLPMISSLHWSALVHFPSLPCLSTCRVADDWQDKGHSKDDDWVGFGVLCGFRHVSEPLRCICFQS